ncbi:hypothetical protein B0H15DRAFT_546756 [Mycena belliarum]|uniref:Nephrocystin 3-like N-terminal domain-containing protein n=1 Tax=Mycena belliarum TaxID=1033014 RepID=A0AAD6UHX6_9AGAR|nr:hypothetical protein B0H15DRAFT_546756 [Mycena belliae]
MSGPSASDRKPVVSIPKHIGFHIDEVAFTSGGNPRKVPRAYVRVRIADRKDRLKTATHLPQTAWQETLAPLALNETAQVTFELRHRPAWWQSRSQRLAATASYKLSELIDTDGSEKRIVLPLCDAAANPPLGMLSVRVRALSSLDAAKLSLASAQHTVHEFNKHSKTLSPKQAARYSAGYDALKPICGILDIVGQFIAFSPEPICAAVIGVVRGAAKSVKEQIEQDADVLALMETITTIYELVAKTAPLQVAYKNRKTPTLEAALMDIVTAIGDCTQFMGSFCKPTFLGRVARTPEKAKELQELQQRLTSSRKGLAQALQLEMLISSRELLRQTAYLATNQALTHLRRVPMDTSGRARYKDDVHAVPLVHVMAWATSAPAPPSGKNVLWLRGPAGCGKSAVATALFDRLSEKQLGGYFFFEGPPRSERDASLVLQTFAAQLIELKGERAQEIVNRIIANPRIGDDWLEAQFNKLLLEPLQAHPPAQPLVFILDGLDLRDREWEAQPQEERTVCPYRETLQDVLRLLVNGAAQLPASVRLVLCSRECESVSDVVRGCEWVEEYEMEAAKPVEWLGWRERVAAGLEF